MSDETLDTKTDVEQVESNNQLVDETKLRLIVKRILDLEQEAINKSYNEEETKKKIMKIIEEELKCY